METEYQGKIEDEMRIVIAGYERTMNDLEDRIEDLRKEYAGLPERIYDYLSWTSENAPGFGSRAVTGEGLAGLVREKESSLQVYQGDIAAAIRQLEEKRSRLARMYLAYMTLPDQQYEILTRLYRDGSPWKRVQAEMQISRRLLIRLRGQALSAMKEAGEGRLKKPAMHQRDLHKAEDSLFSPGSFAPEPWRTHDESRLYPGKR